VIASTLVTMTGKDAWNRRAAAAAMLLGLGAVFVFGSPGSRAAGISPSRSSESGTTLPRTVSGRYVIGGINAMVRLGRAVYVGGEFGRIANRTGSAVVVSAKQGKMERVRAEVAGGPVDAVVADRAGGWYVGGSFTTVGGVHRGGLAHILVNGTLDPVFAPPALGEVRALALAGNVLVAAAGPLDGKAASRALDRTTGAALPLRYAPPRGSGQVRVLLAGGGRLFIGFGNRRLAAYGAASGTRFWSRELRASCSCAVQTGGVAAFALAGDRLLVGGGFAQGRSQNFLVLDGATGSVTGHPVRIPSRVNSIAVVGGKAYVAYDRERPGWSGLSAVDLATGRAHSWGPGGSPLAADDTTVYMAGVLGKDERKSFAEAFYGVYAARAGTRHALFRRVSRRIADGSVLTLAPQGSRLFVGGDFTGAGGPVRHNLAAFDARTGKLLPWGPNSEAVTAMAAARHTIYLGTTHFGDGRDRVAGVPRTGLAAVSAGGAGKLLPWRPRLGYWGIDALAVGAGRVFVGGLLLFPGQENSLRPIPFTNVAAFSARGTGARLRFSPKLGEEFDVVALAVWSRTLIVGGQSVIAYSADGDGRHELWRRNTDLYVSSFATRGSTLYVGGNFDRFGRRPRQSLAALALDRHGALLPFAPKVPIGVQALALFGSDIVFGGAGEDDYDYQRAHQVLGAVTVGGKLEPWHVDVPPDEIDVELEHIAPIEGGLLVGGGFSWLGPEGHQAAGGIAWLR
jgi:hypothetical protein